MQKYPVIEIFGPVLQGEGALLGHQTDFIRFGGCDYRCSWCDTLDAVLPDRIKQLASMLTVDELLDEYRRLDSFAPWLTLSGGNPAIFDCGPVIDYAHNRGKKVAIETQGSIYQPWLEKLDLITVSPKGPSSGMQDKFNYAAFDKILRLRTNKVSIAVKIPIADQTDLEWATQVFSFATVYGVQCYTQPVRDANTDDAIDQLNKLKQLSDWILSDPALSHVIVRPQLHALIGMR